MSTIDQAQIRESPPARDRFPNHWPTPPTNTATMTNRCFIFLSGNDDDELTLTDGEHNWRDENSRQLATTLQRLRPDEHDHKGWWRRPWLAGRTSPCPRLWISTGTSWQSGHATAIFNHLCSTSLTGGSTGKFGKFVETGDSTNRLESEWERMKNKGRSLLRKTTNLWDLANCAAKFKRSTTH